MVDFYRKGFLVRAEDEPLVLSKRQGRWSGSLGTPNALVSKYRIYDFHMVYGRALGPTLPKQVTGYSWKTDITVDFPELIPHNPDDVGRTSNLAAWGASYNELWRIGLAQKIFWDTPEYKLVRDVVSSYAEKIIDTQKKVDALILSMSGSFEDWKAFVLSPEHKDSGVPEYPGKSWKDLSEEELKAAHKDQDSFMKFLVEHPDNYYNRDLIISELFKVQALRFRDCRNQFVFSNDTILSAFEAVRMRTATGVKYQSQKGYVYWGHPDRKAKILEVQHALVKEIAGVDLYFFSTSKTQMFREIADADPTKLTLADLQSGETQWGNTIGKFIPLASSIYDPELLPITLKGDSGMTDTPHFNEILSAANIRSLRESGKIEASDKVFIGSDNACFFRSIPELLNEGKFAGYAGADRFLGWRNRSHWPLNLIRDNARHNITWDGRGSYSFVKTASRLKDILQIVLMYDLLHTDSAVKLYTNFPDVYEESYASEPQREDWFDKNWTSVKDKFPEEIGIIQTKCSIKNLVLDDSLEHTMFKQEA